jgi:protein-tyrosine phosphatase
VLFELDLQGLTPVLAHFERSAGLLEGSIEAEDLVERGYLLQVNCENLLGRRTPEVTALARRLVRDGLAAVLASDCHDAELRPPGLTRCRKLADRLGGDGTFERLTWHNPARIIALT